MTNDVRVRRRTDLRVGTAGDAGGTAVTVDTGVDDVRLRPRRDRRPAARRPQIVRVRRRAVRRVRRPVRLHRPVRDIDVDALERDATAEVRRARTRDTVRPRHVLPPRAVRRAVRAADRDRVDIRSISTTKVAAEWEINVVEAEAAAGLFRLLDVDRRRTATDSNSTETRRRSCR